MVNGRSLKSLGSFLLGVCFIVTSIVTAHADRPRFSFGADPNYTVVINEEHNNSSVDVEPRQLEGVSPTFQASFFEFMALRLRSYSLEDNDHPDATIQLDGMEGGLLFGKYNGGFRIFGGPGYFTEDYQDDDPNNPDTSFSGFKLTAGLGWDWNYVTFDFHLSARENVYDDYLFENEPDPEVSGTHTVGPAYSGGLNISIQI